MLLNYEIGSCGFARSEQFDGPKKTRNSRETASENSRTSCADCVSCLLTKVTRHEFEVIVRGSTLLLL